MRILVIGKDGQLGESIQSLVVGTEQDSNFIFVGREELDLSNSNSIDRYFEVNDRFDMIINCAAYTAVDKAEKERDLANQINHLAVAQMAKIASKQKVKFIHISTDYVFDGESRELYVETDQTNPINIYGETKLAGELAVQEAMPTNAIIIRTSWVYSEYGNNFVKTMLRLGRERSGISVVSDQIGSPTYAYDLARVILIIINSDNYRGQEGVTETYHYSNEGRVSWYEFAKEIFSMLNIACSISPISTEQYPTPAKRPKNTIMSKDKIIKTFDLESIPWKKSLEKCLFNYLEDTSERC